MSLQVENESIRTCSSPTCYLCGTQGKPLYQALNDLLFGVAGVWSFKQCTASYCGLIWLDPMPIEEDLGKTYQTYYTHSQVKPSESRISRLHKLAKDGYLRAKFGYTKGVGPAWSYWFWPLAHLFPTGAGQIEASVMTLSAPQPDARLLDVGCGSGEFLVDMRNLGWQVEGNDFDRLAVETARLRGLLISLGNLGDQKYPEHTFDVITMSHLIEHVYDPGALLREVRRLLKPGGSLVLLTPNTQSLGHRHFAQDWRGLEPPRHIHLFNAMNIRKLLTSANFSHVNTRTLTRGSRYILTMSAAIREARKNQSGPTGFGSEQGPRSRWYQLWARSMQWVYSDSGEELLAIAQ